MATEELKTGRSLEGGWPEAVASTILQLRLVADSAAIERAFVSIVSGAKPPRYRRLEEIFFDTPDGYLRSAGYTLVVFTRRGRRFAKLSAISTNRGVEPVETALGDEAPTLAMFADRAPALIGGMPNADALGEIFTLNCADRKFAKMLGRTQIVVEQATTVIRTDDQEEKVCELGVVLVSGDAGYVYELAAKLVNQFNLALDFTKPLDRAFSLAGYGAPIERRARTPDVAQELGLDELIGAVMDECLNHFTDNWRLLMRSDAPESIHQMRVGLRRLRAALAIFDRAFPHEAFRVLRQQAKEIATTLGHARDIDAFVAMVQEGPVEAIGQNPSLKALLAAAEGERQTAYSIARAALLDPECSTFLLSVQAFMQRRGWRNSLDTSDLPRLMQPSVHFAREVLNRLSRRALKRGKGLTKRPPEERHELRIALKNLRYAADFFGGMFQPQDVRKYTRCVGRLQDLLGAYNDGVVAVSLVKRLEEVGGVETARAVGVVEGWCRRGAIEADHHLDSAWDDFKKQDEFW